MNRLNRACLKSHNRVFVAGMYSLSSECWIRQSLYWIWPGFGRCPATASSTSSDPSANWYATVRFFSSFFSATAAIHGCWYVVFVTEVVSICNGCIVAKRYESVPRLLLITNTKSHIAFQMR